MIKKYQKKNGTTAYMFKAYLGIDPSTGKKRYTTKRGFKTQRAAKQAYARLQVQVQENDVLTDSNRLFSELWNNIEIPLKKVPTLHNGWL